MLSVFLMFNELKRLVDELYNMGENFSIEPVSLKKGRGVMAKKIMRARTILDIAHVLLISSKDYEGIENTSLYGYIFEWDDPESDSKYALAMSPCEFMNHSYDPNSEYDMDYAKKTITFRTIRDVLEGEELTVNYNGHSANKKETVWFEVEASRPL